jgi:sigma-54 specific flagellar transcriptional regulator A
MTVAQLAAVEPSGGSPSAYRDHVLILDEDAERVKLTQFVLKFLNYQCTTVSPERWKQVAEARGREIGVLLGKCSSATEVAGLVRDIHAWNECVPVWVLDVEGNSPSRPLTEPGYRGFVRYLHYPYRQGELINALEQGQIYRESRRQRAQGQSLQLFRGLVGKSSGMQHVRHLIHQVAPTDATVLILGETGTGKEIAARNIHYFSKRRNKPFVAVNCGAIPDELLESELFGHEKGAFTGAITARVGRFEMAHGGTLFLDEIGDMPLPMQVKLLRVLQERTFERVGGSKSCAVDVRVIAATHRDLERSIAEGDFREDLYYRLNVFPIELPALRDRLDDLPLLVAELIARFEASRRGSVRLTRPAIHALSRYAWPGNIRELANLIERLGILHPGGVVDVGNLPAKFCPSTADAAPVDVATECPAAQCVSALPHAQPRLPREGLDLKQHLSNLEIDLINQALDETQGVVAQAASLLGMRRTTLVEKMRKYGLHR